MDRQHESMPGFWSILNVFLALQCAHGKKGGRGLCAKAAMEAGHNLKLSYASDVLFAVTEMFTRDS